MKRQFAKYIYLIICLLLLAQCSNNEQEEKAFKQYRIGLSQCANDTQWRKGMNSHMLSIAVQRQNINLFITDGENSSSKQIKDIDSLLKLGIDLLMVSPNDDSLTEIITKVHKSGMPVILIDRNVNDTNSYTCFIGANNIEISEKIAHDVGQIAPPNSTILEIYGDGSSAAIDRNLGFNHELKRLYGYKNFKNAGCLKCNFSRQESYEKTKEYLKTNKAPDVIYSHNDDMAIGAYEALSEAGYSPDDVLIFGIDGVASPEGGIKGVIDNKIDITYLYPDGSEEAIDVAEKILLGIPVEKNIKLATVKIDNNNANGLFEQLTVKQKQDKQIIRIQKLINDLDSFSKDLQSQNDRQHLWIMIFISLIVIGVIMMIVIVRLNITVRKNNQSLNEKNIEIGAQKEELQTQAAYLSEVNYQLEHSKEKTLGSIRYAHTIQAAALPSEEELNKEYTAFISYHPKDIVSGDFYWYHNEYLEEEDKTVSIFGVIDCTGHGVPGAFMSLIGINLLNQIVKQHKNYSPAQILDELNSSIRRALHQDENDNNDGMEAIICKIEKFNKTNKLMLTYEGAKFPIHHYIKSEKRIETYKSSRRQVGGQFRNIESIVKFEDHEVELHDGDRLYLTSDGIGDQNNIDRKRYTTKRFVEILEKTAGLSMADQRDTLWKDVSDFMFNCEQRDDITVMGIEV